MSIKYHTIKDIHRFFGYYKDYYEWEKTSEKIKNNLKYGNCIFETGWNDHVYFIAMNDNELVGILKFKRKILIKLCLKQ